MHSAHLQKVNTCDVNGFTVMVFFVWHPIVFWLERESNRFEHFVLNCSLGWRYCTVSRCIVLANEQRAVTIHCMQFQRSNCRVLNYQITAHDLIANRFGAKRNSKEINGRACAPHPATVTRLQWHDRKYVSLIGARIFSESNFLRRVWRLIFCSMAMNTARSCSVNKSEERAIVITKYAG